MKTRILLLVSFATALALSLNVTAHDGDDEDQHDSHHGPRNDCKFTNDQTLNAVVLLEPTTNAPANARGVAKLESKNHKGEQKSKLEFKLFGLNPGDYLLNLTLAVDTNGVTTNIILGQITIDDPKDKCDNDDDEDKCDEDKCDEDKCDEDKCDDDDWNHHHHFQRHDWDKDDDGPWVPCNWGGFTNWGSWTNWSTTNWCHPTNKIIVVKAKVKLPADLDPTDITQIIVSDTNGVPILEGDLVTPAPTSVINISADVQVIPCEGAPAADGTAQVRSTASKGKWKHQFNVTATDLPAKSNFKVFVNDKKIGATRSGKTGQMTIKKLPGKIPAIRSVRLVDTKGREAARADF